MRLPADEGAAKNGHLLSQIFNSKQVTCVGAPGAVAQLQNSRVFILAQTPHESEVSSSWSQVDNSVLEASSEAGRQTICSIKVESLILAQIERWRQA